MEVEGTRCEREGEIGRSCKEKDKKTVRGEKSKEGKSKKGDSGLLVHVHKTLRGLVQLNNFKNASHIFYYFDVAFHTNTYF